jgi:diadenosine tetraphosphatase ApaH/serine/threonine PP2A family protein phosphatase/Ca2+-binding EF-hand superfamily protein
MSPELLMGTGLAPGYDTKQWGCWKSHALLLKAAVTELGWEDKRARLTEIFTTFARDEFMYEREFTGLFVKLSLGTGEEASPVFQLLDRDQDGTISVNEFVAGLLAFAPSTPHEISNASGQLRLQLIFLLYDSDRDGLLNNQELSVLLEHLRVLIKHKLPSDDTDLLISMYSGRFGFAAFYECVACSMLSGTSLLLRLPIDVTDSSPRRPPSPLVQALPRANTAPVEAVNSAPKAETPRRSFRASEIDPRRGVGFVASDQQDEREFGKLKEKLQVEAGPSADPRLAVPLRIIRYLMEATSGPKVDWDTLKLVETEAEMIFLCEEVQEILKTEDSVVDVKLPCRIYGDVHGNLPDLTMMFNSFSWPDRRKGDILSMNYVFLGDWVDRGRFSVEVVVVLFCLKILYPRKVHLVRGNHEDRVMNAVFGFRDNCVAVFSEEGGDRVWSKINEVFDHLPLAAVVEKEVLLIHGGIGENISSVDELRNIRKPIYVPSEVENSKLNKLDKIILDALWSDPTDNDHVLGVHLSPRGEGACRYGPDRVEEFCLKNSLKMIIRAHECVQRGYEYFAKGRLITVFSSTSYCNQYDNDAAMIVLVRNEDGVIEEHPLVLKAGHPDSALGWTSK